MRKFYEVFMDNCNNFPNNVAIIDGDEKITNSILSQYATSIATYLKENIKENSIISIVGKKSYKSIAAILGISMARMVYLPIDITYPQERIDYIIKNSNTELLILIDTDFLNFEIQQVNVDDILSRKSIRFEIENTPSSDICYIIYTSGTSTNEPNGVVVSHNAISNTICWRNEYYKFTRNDKILLFSSLSFDTSVEDIFCALTTGAKLIIIDDRKKVDPRYIQHIIKKFSVTHLMLVPSIYSFFLQFISDTLNMLKCVTLAGEDFSKDLIQHHYQLCPKVKLYNEYGPTENSVCSTCSFLDKHAYVNIGYPISNVGCFLLDDDEINESYGELCLYGEGLANGYLNNEKLTSKKFQTNNQFNSVRYYKTGDYVEKIDGKYVYRGRADSVVKINGIRLDLQEIVYLIKKHFLDINEAYALGYNNNGTKVALFYTTKTGNDIVLNELKSILFYNLPYNIVPSFIMKLEHMPVLPNYKIDINKLKQMID